MKDIEQLKAEAAELRMQTLAEKRALRKAASTLVCNHEQEDKQINMGQKIRNGKYEETIWYCKSCEAFHE